MKIFSAFIIEDFSAKCINFGNNKRIRKGKVRVSGRVATRESERKSENV